MIAYSVASFFRGRVLCVSVWIKRIKPFSYCFAFASVYYFMVEYAMS
jgi:hypothetical protein